MLDILNSDEEAMKPHAMLKLIEIEREELALAIANINKKVPPEALAKLIKNAMLEKIKKLRDYREGIYALNDELRAKGVPFEERKKQLKLERISLCERKESELADHLRRFRVRPLSEWLGRYDLKMAKDRGIGMGGIIGLNLEYTYVVPEK